MNDKLAWDAALFEYAQDWKPNILGWQPVPDHVRVKVRYSDGSVSAYVREARAWRTWSGGRDYWQKPSDGRLYIAEYVVIG